MSDSKKDTERKKKEVMDKLKNGEFIAKAEPSSSSHGSFCQHLLRVKCSSDEYQPFVQCRLCNDILSYSISNGTSTISYHVKNCLEKSTQLKNKNTLDKYLNKPNEVSVSFDDKRSITVACAKFCSFDMRSFNIVKGSGFKYLCQSLINLGYQYGVAKLGAPTSRSLLPDPTNISRTVSRISEDYRKKLKDLLQIDLQRVKLIGISTDYWKNGGTSESYLTINVHYCRDEDNVTYMLHTCVFEQSKTDDNTKKRIFSILSSYDIDPNKYHIIYVTDNGSTLVCGFKGEVHLRCICHCLNLTLHNGVKLCRNLELLIKSCQDLCSRFKRCEINQLLPTNLKLNVETRWNSIHDMFESISLNFNNCEDLFFERNEVHYLYDVNRKLVVDVEKFLSLFKLVSEKLSADTSPTLHLVVPWFWKLKTSCKCNDDDHLLLVQFKSAVSKMLDDKVHLTSLHYIATCLYPATKKLQTLDDSYRNEIYTDMRKIMVTLGIREEHSSLSYKTNSRIDNKRSKKTKNNIMENDVMVEFAGDIEEDSDDESDELERYLKTKISFTNNDTLLKWWNKHSLIFPQLAILAKTLLGVPASSATSERVFSSSGRILEKRRQSLNSDVVDDMLMIRNFRDM
ncbi:unnamed protein product [Adineta ricciae]|uniref:HAT C-terminal dimerisation domain-containing protein n=1 Tax=Adineta ricciae TaxID=249248 RepID=A0A816DTJ6_ADIRI|nr:unnamed protein product [Adineta ricciae]CAF1637152.1 unnamed protein product [Adineta ricciae]